MSGHSVSAMCPSSFIDLNPPCQGQGYSSKGRIELSPHESFHSEVTDPWGEGAIKKGEKLEATDSLEWTRFLTDELIVDGSYVDEHGVDGSESHVALN